MVGLGLGPRGRVCGRREFVDVAWWIDRVESGLLSDRLLPGEAFRAAAGLRAGWIVESGGGTGTS